MVLLTNLRELRRRKALTQQELADLAGIHRVTVARIETGSDRPEAATIRKLARALDVDVSELGEREEAPGGGLTDLGNLGLSFPAEQSAVVHRLVHRDATVLPLIAKAIGELRRYFGEVEFELRAVADPDYDEADLLLAVRPSVEPDVAWAALDRFDREWWFNRPADSPNLIIDVVWD